MSDFSKEMLDQLVKLLCSLATVKTTRFYIPGETNDSDELRKEAYDKGVYITLNLIYKDTKEKLPSSHKFIWEKVLNLIELSDLQYHQKVIESAILKT